MLTLDHFKHSLFIIQQESGVEQDSVMLTYLKTGRHAGQATPHSPTKTLANKTACSYLGGQLFTLKTWEARGGKLDPTEASGGSRH